MAVEIKLTLTCNVPSVFVILLGLSFPILWSANLPLWSGTSGEPLVQAVEKSEPAQVILKQPQAESLLYFPVVTIASERTVTFFRNGGNNTKPEVGPETGFMLDLNPNILLSSYIPTVLRELGYPSSTDIILCNRTGSEVRTTQDAIEARLLFVVPWGEWFIWPGLYVGAKVPLWEVKGPTPGRLLELETLSLSPRIFVIRDFVSAAEAGELIHQAEPSLARSMVSPYGGKQNVNEVSEVRNSEHMWLPDDTRVARVLGRRVEELTKVPQANAELMQVVHYDPGQHYHAHHDYFDPAMYPDREDLMHGRNRMITVLYYLNTVAEGGQTVFPRGGETGYGMNTIYDFSGCDRGVVVPPTPYSAVMFYSLEAEGHMDGKVDPMSLHGGCDVVRGEKWAANKWVYNKPLGYRQGPVGVRSALKALKDLGHDTRQG